MQSVKVTLQTYFAHFGFRPLSQRDLPELDRKETYQGDQVIEMQPIHTNHTADSNDYDDFDDFDLDDVPEHLFTEISGRPFDTSVPPVDPQTQQSITRPEAHGEAPAHSSTKPLLRTSDRKLAIAQLRTAFTEFYRGLTLLNNFARLNVEAIEKILKKHDKNIELGARERYMNYILVEFSFYRRRSLKALMRETEVCFCWISCAHPAILNLSMTTARFRDVLHAGPQNSCDEAFACP